MSSSASVAATWSRRDRSRSTSSSRSSAWFCCSTRWRRRLPRTNGSPATITRLADVAFTPYLARLEHLNILGMIGERHRVADWYRRCKARPSFHDAIVKWENADYLGLMQRRGAETLATGSGDHAGVMSLPAAPGTDESETEHERTLHAPFSCQVPRLRIGDSRPCRARASGLRADLPDAEHHFPGRLRGRRHCRCRRAPGGTEVDGAPGAHGGG